MQTIYDFVKKQRDNYRSETIEIVEGYDYSQYETLRTIELYHNSRFTTGNKDTLGREKPFYNICKFRVNVAVRATDLDTKDVKIESERVSDKSFVASFVLNLKSRNWMKRSGFANFLNEMGQTRAKYGGVLVRKTEDEGELKISVMPWRDMVTDQVDIRSGVKIFRDYYTPSDLKRMEKKGWKNTKEAIDAAKQSKEAIATGDQARNKTPGAYVEVYFIDGVLPTCYLAGTSEKYPADYGSETEYERQFHAIVLDESTKTDTKGVTLFGGVSDEDPYKYKEYEKVPGRGLGVGVVEDLFEAQVWTNDSVKKKKDILELAGKIILQTSDANLAAKNILTDIENGQILFPAKDQPISQLNNGSGTLPAFDTLMQEWDQQAERVSSTFNAITGETMPSGTPYRQTAILNQEAGSLFEYRREEGGQLVQEIYYDWVLPFLVKQIKQDKELTATLEPEELELVSEALANYEALKHATDTLIPKDGSLGQAVDQANLEQVKATVREAEKTLRRKGFKDFAKYFEGYEPLVDVITTGEQKNKAVVLESLNNAIKFIVAMQLPDGRNLVMENETMRRLFNQLVEIAGISPVMLLGNSEKLPQAAPSPVPAQPAQQPAPTPAL